MLLTTLLKAWIEEFLIVTVLHFLQTNYLSIHNGCNCNLQSVQYLLSTRLAYLSYAAIEQGHNTPQYSRLFMASSSLSLQSRIHSCKHGSHHVTSLSTHIEDKNKGRQSPQMPQIATQTRMIQLKSMTPIHSLYYPCFCISGISVYNQ